MTRVTYGISSSAFPSSRYLLEIAMPVGCAVNATARENEFYVDYFLSGADTVEDAKVKMHAVYDELLKYRLPLRKWSSSHPKLIMELPEELRENADAATVLEKGYKIKVLGVTWKPNADFFQFQVSLPEVPLLTKRSFLSDAAKLLDPLGLLTPVVINYKCLMQETWIKGIECDEELPESIVRPWRELRQTLPEFDKLTIRRCV